MNSAKNAVRKYTSLRPNIARIVGESRNVSDKAIVYPALSNIVSIIPRERIFSSGGRGGRCI